MPDLVLTTHLDPPPPSVVAVATRSRAYRSAVRVQRRAPEHLTETRTHDLLLAVLERLRVDHEAGPGLAHHDRRIAGAKRLHHGRGRRRGRDEINVRPRNRRRLDAGLRG